MAGKPPEQPSGMTRSIGDFRTFLDPIQGQLGGIAQTLIARGTGAEQDPLIEAQRRQGLMGQSGQMGRAGITGSTAENAQARLNAGFDQAQLGARDEALKSGTSVLQSTAQNALAIPGLEIGAEAARRAGQKGGKK